MPHLRRLVFRDPRRKLVREASTSDAISETHNAYDDGDEIVRIDISFEGGVKRGVRLLRGALTERNIPERFHEHLVRVFRTSFEQREKDGASQVNEKTIHEHDTRDDEDEFFERVVDATADEASATIAGAILDDEDDEPSKSDDIFRDLHSVRNLGDKVLGVLVQTMVEYSERMKTLREKWRRRGRALDALQTEELNLLSERNEGAVFMLRNKQRLAKQRARHNDASRREQNQLRAKFRARFKRKLGNALTGERREHDVQRPAANVSVVNEPSFSTRAATEDRCGEDTHAFAFYCGPYDVAKIEIGFSRRSGGVYGMLSHRLPQDSSRNQRRRRRLDAHAVADDQEEKDEEELLTRSRLLSLRRLATAGMSLQVPHLGYGLRAVVLPMKFARDPSRDQWDVSPALMKLCEFTAPEMLFPSVTEQIATLRKSDANVVVTRHSSLRVQIIFHCVPFVDDTGSEEVKREIVRTIIRRAASLGVVELTIPLPLCNYLKILRTFKAVFTEFATRQSRAQPFAARGVSAHRAMPHARLGHLERVTFVQNDDEIDRIGFVDPLALRLDRVLATESHDNGRRGTTNGRSTLRDVARRSREVFGV